nr:NAD-binding protein [Nesterenkonia sp. PF2B19]
MGTVVDCGEQVGRGQAFKAVNQLLCSVHIVAAAEALALAETLGLEPEAVLDAVSAGAAASWMLADRGPRMLEGLAGVEPEVRSAVGIFVKDSGLVAEIAAAHDLDTPLLRAAQAKYAEAAAAGLIGQDDSQVIRTYR